uniref:Uncharacterized protein n=1 Tax=Caenorhabditis japonica TaxID=281687 RepID=A0A8R1E7E5_CAEJA
MLNEILIFSFFFESLFELFERFCIGTALFQVFLASSIPPDSPITVTASGPHGVEQPGEVAIADTQRPDKTKPESPQRPQAATEVSMTTPKPTRDHMRENLPPAKTKER